MAKTIEVKWTGTYPNLCSGYWVIKIDGVELIDIKNLADIKNFRCPTKYAYNTFMTKDMGTRGYYDSWHFTDDWDVDWDSYDDGADEDSWWKTEQGLNIIQLLQEHNINLTDEELLSLYREIASHDWRSGSCGGCI